MKIVVTGATSFLGAPTVRRLLVLGHRVCAVIRPNSANLPHLLKQVPEEDRGRLQIVELDLKNLSQIAESKSIWSDAGANRDNAACADAWIHIGWEGAGSDNRVRRDVQQANVDYALSAVRTAAELGCRRFLFTGSQAEYGICHDWIGEEQECHPVSEYGIAKTLFCKQAISLCKSLNMEYIHMRIFSVYGPGDHPWSLVSSCLRTWQKGETIKLGECTQQWNFLYVEDAVEALVCLLTDGRPGVYNIAGKDTRPLRAYIEEMYELCGRRGGFSYGERPQNAEGPADLMPDIRKLCRETGWTPKTTFAEGINETLYRMREDAAKGQSV